MSTSFVRLAVSADAQAISDVRIASWKEGYRGLIDQAFLDSLETTPERLQRLETMIAAQDALFLLYEIDSRVVGFLHGGNCRDQDEPCSQEIYAFYVDPEYQRRGIGKALFLAFEEKRGVDGFFLWTLPGSKGDSFYSKMGGVQQGEIDKEIGGKMYKQTRYIWK